MIPDCGINPPATTAAIISLSSQRQLNNIKCLGGHRVGKQSKARLGGQEDPSSGGVSEGRKGLIIKHDQ